MSARLPPLRGTRRSADLDEEDAPRRGRRGRRGQSSETPSQDPSPQHSPKSSPIARPAHLPPDDPSPQHKVDPSSPPARRRRGRLSSRGESPQRPSSRGESPPPQQPARKDFEPSRDFEVPSTLWRNESGPTIAEDDVIDENAATTGVGAGGMQLGGYSQPSNVLYVESGGEFKKTTAANLENARETNPGSVAAESTIKSVVDTFSICVSTCFLFCQGLHCGVMTMIIYLSTWPTNILFLKHYSSMAVSLQRLSFALCAVCTVAACDKYFKDKMAGWLRGGARQHFRDALIIILYSLCLLFGLLNAPLDDLLYYSELRLPGWYLGEVPDQFWSSLTLFHALNFSRFFCAVLAFALICLDTRAYMFNASNTDLHINFLQSLLPSESRTCGSCLAARRAELEGKNKGRATSPTAKNTVAALESSVTSK